MEKQIIFYIDDHDDILNSLTIDLKKEFKQIEVIVQDNINTILSQIKDARQSNHKIPIVFVGEKILNKHGNYFFIELKQLISKTNIILLSAKESITNISKNIRSIGCYNYLTKKFLSENLKITVNEAISNYNMNLQLENSYKKDSLTGLLNRTTLLKHIDELSNPALLLINIDNFRYINARYGYKCGDKILKKFAQYLNTKADINSLYRVISDEFGILFNNVPQEDIYLYAKEIHEELQHKKIIIDDEEIINMTFSMSLSKNRDSLIEDAQTAIYETLKKTNNTISFADEVIKRQANEFSKKQLLHAFKHNKVIPYFQGIRNNKTKQIDKYECLVRIKDEMAKVISPNQFLELAKSIGLLPEITKIMIHKSFQIFSKNDFSLSINLSEEDFKTGYLITYIVEEAEKNNIDLKRVTFEILENINLEDSAQIREQIKALKKLGCLIAFDDFGCEKSNFSRLLDLNIDVVKIDGMFIKNIDSDEKCYKLSKAIANLSKDLGCKVVAECVETKEEQEIIEKLNIEYTQGYYYSKPQEKI